MPLSVHGVACALVAVLLVWRADELRTDACSCAPVHPQQAFCNADVACNIGGCGGGGGALVVMLVVVELDTGNDIYGNPIKRIQYDIKQIKMFKGPSQDIEAVLTAPVSAVCGVTLDTSGKKEYLISGKAEGGGRMHIVRCPTLPCEISAPEECLWTDLIIEKQVYGRQANHYACVKRADSSCSWYRGIAPPKKDFLDTEDP
ncbi:hypothetical protein CRUP_023280 [Coryphaenoides rupestris]|nr:hypothetical protein CRUP_023280 [Coryphaenoides rupestris]